MMDHLMPMFVVLSATLLLATYAGNTQASEGESLNEGIYNKQQVKSGKKLYKKFCRSCHEGEYFAPVFLAWQGEPLSSLFEVMTTAMPENNPGGLKKNQYTELLAYILNTSGYPAGVQPLDTSSTTFSRIVIEKPKQN